MDIHRARFIKYTPKAVTHLAATPAHFPHPLLAVSRGSEIDILSPSATPLPSSSIHSHVSAHRHLNKITQLNWQTIGRISGERADSTVESVLWHVDRLEDGSLKPRLLVGFVDGWIREFDPITLKCTAKVDSMGGGMIWSLKIVNDRFLVAGCEDGGVRVYDLVDGLEYIRSFEKMGCPVISMCWNGEYLFCGSNDGKIRVFDFKTGRAVSRMVAFRSDTGDEVYIWDLAVVKDKCIVSADSRGSVKFWDCSTFTLIQSFVIHQSDVLCLAVNIQGNHVAASGIDPRIAMLSLGEDGKWYRKRSWRSHTHDVRAMVWAQTRQESAILQLQQISNKRSADGNQVLEIPAQKTVQTKESSAMDVDEEDSNSDTEIQENKEKEDKIANSKFSEFAFDCLVSGGVDLQLHCLTSPQRLKEGNQKKHIPLFPLDVVQLTKTRMVMSYHDKEIHVHSLGTAASSYTEGDGIVPMGISPKFVYQIKIDTKGSIKCAAISEDSKLVYACDTTGKHHFYRLENDLVEKFEGCVPSFRSVTAKFSGRHLIVCSSDFTVHIIRVSVDFTDGEEAEKEAVIERAFDLRAFVEKNGESGASVLLMEVAETGSKIAISDTKNRKFLIDLKTEEISLLPTLSDCFTTSMKFAEITYKGEQKEVLIIAEALTSFRNKELTRLQFYDIATCQYMPDITEAFNLLRTLKTKKKSIRQITIRKEGGSSEIGSKKDLVFYLNGAIWISRINFTVLMSKYQQLVDNYGNAKGKRSQFIDSMQSLNQMTNEFENLLLFEFMDSTEEVQAENKNKAIEAVAIERPWAHIVDELPPMFAYKKFQK